MPCGLIHQNRVNELLTLHCLIGSEITLFSHFLTTQLFNPISIKMYVSKIITRVENIPANCVN